MELPRLPVLELLAPRRRHALLALVDGRTSSAALATRLGSSTPTIARDLDLMHFNDLVEPCAPAGSAGDCYRRTQRGDRALRLVLKLGEV